MVLRHSIGWQIISPLFKKGIGNHGGTHGVAVLIGVHAAEFFPVHLTRRDQIRQLLGEVIDRDTVVLCHLAVRLDRIRALAFL